MSVTPNTAGRFTTGVVTVALIALTGYIFRDEGEAVSITTIMWPPTSIWVACFVGGVILGEAVRRRLGSRD